MTKENVNDKKGKELSFIKKCIILANLYQNENKYVINSFDNIPLVKLFTANIKDELFIYSKIKGALLFVCEQNDKVSNYFLQIYNIDDYSMVFNLPINQKILEGIVGEEKMICILTKYYSIGFKFSSMDSMKKFILTLKAEKQISDINMQSKKYECQKEELIKVIKNLKENLDKKLKSIDQQNDKSNKQQISFQKFDELYRLINCVEYSEINNKINIFIDKTINPFIIKSYIDAYKNSKNKNLLPYKIVFNDYNQIKEKSPYISILVKNLINNFEEEKRLIIFKREHKKRHEKEQYAKTNSIEIRGSAMIPRPKNNIEDK